MDIKDNLITITHVVTSPDLATSKIFVTTLKKNLSLIDMLNNASHTLKHHLSKNMKCYKIPKFVFIYDDALINTDKIKMLLEKTKKWI